MCMNRNQFRFAFALMAAAAGMGAAANAQTQTFRLIGALPGSNTFSSGYGVSEDGSVVVGHSGNNYYYGSSSHAFRWSDETGIQDLDVLAPAAAAYAVSGDGLTIAGSEISGSTSALRWGTSNSAVSEQLFHGGEIYGISRDGSTFVGYDASGGGGGGGGGAFRPHRAIRYTDRGRVEFIDTNALANTSEALGASADGSVVVGWTLLNTVGNRAFRWTAADGMVNIAASVVSNYSRAAAVSGDGSVVVGEFNTNGAVHAFRWTAAGGFMDMGTLPGFRTSSAYAITADGSTIFGRSTDATGLNQRAFIWRADLGMRDLNVILGGVVPAGFVLTEARACNATGTVIAGGSKTPTNGVEAWVVTGFTTNVCAADFNRSGAADVADIFDFLTVWFASDVRADFNGVDGVGVADIFDFLTAWFAGCP